MPNICMLLLFAIFIKQVMLLWEMMMAIFYYFPNLYVDRQIDCENNNQLSYQ